jgi:O-acetyl-ADP-ribose deacetylase
VLKKLIKKCFKKLIKNDYKSISFPAISTGNYDFPREKCADIFSKVIKSICEDEDYDDITEIRIVNFDYETSGYFESAFEKYFQNNVVNVDDKNNDDDDDDDKSIVVEKIFDNILN